MADLENGYTRIANEILEKLATIKLSPTQYRILFIIWRYTYGFNRKETDLALSFISNATGCNLRSIQRELKGLEDMGIILQQISHGKSRKVSFNKHLDSWLTFGETANGNSANGQTANGETAKSHLAKLPIEHLAKLPKKKESKDNSKEIYIVLFEYWNSKQIIVHKKLTEKMITKISGTLKNYSPDEIKTAIDNYTTVTKGDEYYWTYKWTLEDFLQRGMEKFLHKECFENYRCKPSGQPSQSERPEYKGIQGGYTPRRFKDANTN